MQPHALERTVLIRALPSTVFATFTEPARFAAWWGAGSDIDPRVGGAVRIVYPNGVAVSGSVLAIEPERRVVFTYGYENGAGPIPPGASTVEIVLDPHPLGTLLHLVHRFDDASARDAHVPGWRYQLAVFANVAASAQHGDLDDLADRFFAAQTTDGVEARTAAIAALVTDDFTFRDTFACVRGAAEFAQHLEAARAHGAAPAIERTGPVRHCQGTAVWDWVARTPDGGVLVEGTNVVELAPDGRIAAAVGLWALPGR
ncbi:MAG: SRPBCC domain-containing protein [Planctomycetota bacterium]